ncbi:3-oxo-5-alpha-steroid 4-dehydrogenase-like protein [Massariosphaeria phaeospora]|uniref:Polyprenal reductase n=1 Tax=Massariosphaeria phaeospora TaxID=100035 RepID=A0A7C8I626_9PLEO|nr:3-oxo-5-alpha-steroid 4-dehydrogenase-like protein [Massariosphaeria phaeospora]
MPAVPQTALVLRAFYLAASALILVIHVTPALKCRFLPYGSRATAPATDKSTATHHPPREAPPRELSPRTSETRPVALTQLLDYAASLRVPHSWFTHFYVLSVASSLIWGYHVRLYHPTTPAHVQTTWLFMLLQGLRRFLESSTYTSSSKSRMWVGHWLLGFIFYLSVNVAVWVEGVGGTGAQELGDRWMWKAAVLVPAVLTAHGLQHVYHAYLYRLRTQNKGYQLPAHPLFPNLLCPHYTCEIAIYLLLSFLAARPDKIVDWTLLSATVFVAVNLGVTAEGTRDWYVEKFGKDKIEKRRRMIPWIW